MTGKQQYITLEGERWDTVSWKAYGSVELIPLIAAANPSVPITDRLLAGVTLIIPVIDSGDKVVDTNLLPPWKIDF